MREIIGEDLQFIGAEVFEAENGRIAFDLCLQLQPHALVSDVRMPGGDGLELIRRLREHFGADGMPAVFLITGFADLTIPEATELGVRGMLPKPFNLQQLRELLIENLN